MGDRRREGEEKKRKEKERRRLLPRVAMAMMMAIVCCKRERAGVCLEFGYNANQHILYDLTNLIKFLYIKDTHILNLYI